MEVKDNPSSEDVKTQETSQEVKPEVGAIPYDRFKEVNEERKKLEKELEKLKKQIEENETSKLKEKEKFKELYEKNIYSFYYNVNYRVCSKHSKCSAAGFHSDCKELRLY